MAAIIYGKHYEFCLYGRFLVSDVGYYIDALGGFPGPFIKFVNETLKAKDILALMKGKRNRGVILRECLIYSTPDALPRVFVSEQEAVISELAEGNGSSIDQVLVLDGFDRPKGACPPGVIFDHWKKTLKIYHDMASCIADTV